MAINNQLIRVDDGDSFPKVVDTNFDLLAEIDDCFDHFKGTSYLVKIKDARQLSNGIQVRWLLLPDLKLLEELLLTLSTKAT